uniref:Uncharacterized protein n=1 Tax=Solanum lycopersicum TaxID=4081 RepID=A0A3Q7FLI9_SOLLC
MAPDSKMSEVIWDTKKVVGVSKFCNLRQKHPGKYIPSEDSARTMYVCIDLLSLLSSEDI